MLLKREIRADVLNASSVKDAMVAGVLKTLDINNDIWNGVKQKRLLYTVAIKQTHNLV